jgi:hypothetical protein
MLKLCNKSLLLWLHQKLLKLLVLLTYFIYPKGLSKDKNLNVSLLNALTIFGSGIT